MTNVQHQYKSVLGTAAAIAAAVMGENGHSCDGESHMAGGGRRVDALVPPVGRHGYRFLPSSPWSRYKHPPARPTMHVTGSRSPREAVSEWGQTSVKAMISTGSPRPFPTRPLPQHMYAQYYAGRYGNLQYGNYDTKVNITKTMIAALAMNTIVPHAAADRPSWRNSRTVIGVSRDMSVAHLSRNRHGYGARCRHLQASVT